MPDRSVSADAIVIGAGIAGASVAAGLSRTMQTVLVEMEAQPGYHTTGRSAAVFAPSYGPQSVRALTRASRSFFGAPPDGFTDNPLLTPREILMLAREDQLEALDRLIDTASSETRVERLVPEALRALQPLVRAGYAAAGMLDKDGQDIDVAALHQGFLRVFKARGGQLLNNAPVQALERIGNDWEIQTKIGTLTAPLVINAAGAWAEEIGQLAGAERIGLVPKQRTAMVVAEPEGFTRRDAPITIDVEEQFYLKPDAGRLLISPADETPTVPCDAQPEEIDVAICADRIMTAFDLDIRRIDNKWAGLRSFVSDKEPVIGYSKVAPGFFWMAGQGGYGIQSAPAAAELATALVQGTTLPAHILDQGLDPLCIKPDRMAYSA